MGNSDPIVVLTFFTLLSGVVLAGGSLLYSLRKREGREIARRALVGREESETQSDQTFDGALPDLLILLIISLAIMALLAVGYVFR